MATISEKFFSKDPIFDAVCRQVYGCNAEEQSARFAELAHMHKKTFGKCDIEFYSSPGRIEIVGNHTDHNGGKVLAAAINFDTLAAVSKRDDGIIEVKSHGYHMLRVDTANPHFSTSELGTSTALIKGVVDYYKHFGKKVGGFSACMTSTVPKGSGVSSSSSFELVIAEVLNVLYNGGTLPAMFKAKASQHAENNFFGKPSGLMDQSAIALGGVNLIDFKSFDNPHIEQANWNFDDLDIYVISTGGDHSNLNDDYAAIPTEMKQVAKLFDVDLLHQVDRSAWEKFKSSIKQKVSERAYLRAEHFFEENDRVEFAYSAIKTNDERAFLALVNESGISSRYKLQNTYSSAAQSHELEDALDRVVKIGGVVASRVHGGGFAGTILVFVKKEFTKGAHLAFDAMFGKKNVFELSIRSSGAIRLPLELN